MPKLCIYEGCLKRPNFDEPGGKGSFCFNHKKVTMINVKSKRCIYEGCDSICPIFDEPDGKGSYCKNHKKPNMINVKNKKCLHKECYKRPNFDEPGGKGSYCRQHKTDTMIDVKHPICLYKNCLKRPNFDEPGGKGSFCFNHKTKNMIDVTHKICLHNNCYTRPTFDEPGGKGSYCYKHKSPNMIDVINKRCLFEGCECISPIFDEPGGKGSYCFNHKSPTMINIKNNTCLYDDCSKRPNFDEPGGKGSYCRQHKSDSMIDVRHRKCIYCTSRSYYGKPGNPPSHCARHRESGMIRRSNGKCNFSDCKQTALYGQNWIPIHCEKHKTINDQNLVERECKSCKLIMILDINNQCEYCNPVTFQSARLVKQTALFNYLDKRTDLPIPYSSDKIIDDGSCGKERPDRVYDLGDRIIIIECDENQHKNRSCECEQTRMINIGQTFGGTPIYFLRWNPDDYSPENEKKDPEIISKRYSLLGDLIRDIKNNNYSLPNALISAIYLYYDGWSTLNKEKWHILTKYNI